jgi:hypothetical protein
MQTQPNVGVVSHESCTGLAWHRIAHANAYYLHASADITRQKMNVESQREWWRIYTTTHQKYEMRIKKTNKWARERRRERRRRDSSTKWARSVSAAGIRSSVMDGQRRSNDSLVPIGLLLIHFIIEMDRVCGRWAPFEFFVRLLCQQPRRTQPSSLVVHLKCNGRTTRRGETQSESHEQVLTWN